MASVEYIIKILKGKTALYSMGNGNASAIPKRNFMDVAMEINKLFYEPPPNPPIRCSKCGGTKILTYHNQTGGEVLRRDCPYCIPNQSGEE